MTSITSGFANASKKLGELKSDRAKRSRGVCVCVPVSDSALGRPNAIVDYLKEETVEGFDDFIKSLLWHPYVAAAAPRRRCCWGPCDPEDP